MIISNLLFLFISTSNLLLLFNLFLHHFHQLPFPVRDSLFSIRNLTKSKALSVTNASLYWKQYQQNCYRTSNINHVGGTTLRASTHIRAASSLLMLSLAAAPCFSFHNNVVETNRWSSTYVFVLISILRWLSTALKLNPWLPPGLSSSFPVLMIV